VQTVSTNEFEDGAISRSRNATSFVFFFSSSDSTSNLFFLSTSTNSSRRSSPLARAAANSNNNNSDSSSNKTEAELTTEKYGLEAGLWKVLTGGTKKKDGDEVSTSSSSSSSSSSSPSSLSRTDQAKALLKTYGSAYLLTSISFALVSFGACYALVTAGVDVGGLVEKLPAALGGGARPGATGERVGAFAIAYAAHKALSPVRFPPTVALTPVVAKWLGKNPSSEAEEVGGKK
jgi:hypothetical protein